MRMGMGVSPFNYWQTDCKTANLCDPLVVSYPPHKDGFTYGPNGWPTMIPDVDYPDNFMGWVIAATEGYLRPGRYRILADGAGVFCFQHPDVKGRQARPVIPSRPGKLSRVLDFTVRTTSARALCAVLETDPNNPITNVIVYRIGDNATKTFSPTYVSELKHFDTLRMAGFTNAIASPDTDWPSNHDDPSGRVAEWVAAFSLCNATDSNVWINIPHAATDNYVIELARLAKAVLKPELKVYLEYSIEVWNWAYPFSVATNWVEDWGNAQSPPITPYQFAAVERAYHVQEVFHQAAPDIPIVRLFCDQFVWPGLFEQACQWIDYKGYTFDAIGTAPYVDCIGLDWDTIDQLLAKGQRSQALDLVFQGYEDGLAALDAYAQEYSELCQARGFAQVCYECGPGWTIPPGWPASRKALYMASHRDKRMLNFLSKQYFPWLAQYYDLAMYTQHTSRPGPGDFWGVRAFSGEKPCPKLDACLAWCAKYN